MERDERDRADALDRYWDVIQRGDRPSATVAIEDELAALVAGLHAARVVAPVLFPDPEQAWRQLRQTPTPSPRPRRDAAAIPAPAHPNGRAAFAVEDRPAAARRRGLGGGFFAQAATAALLLLTLAGGFAAVTWRRPEPPAATPWATARVSAVASSSGGVTDTPLLATTFSAEELPSGEKEAAYYQLTIPPGARLAYPGAPFCDCFTKIITKGVGAEVVRSGSYTLRLAAPLRVQRAGSTRPTEEIAPGTDVTLGPGDAVIYPNYAAAGELRDTGAAPVSLIGVAIVGTDGAGAPLPQLQQRTLLEEGVGTSLPAMPPGVQATLLANTVPSDWAKLPPGPLNVALREVTLPPGARFGPYQPIGLEALFVASGTITRGLQLPGKIAPEPQTLIQLPGTTSPLMAPHAGVRDIIVSTGDTRAEVLALLIEPDPTNPQGPAS